MSNKVDKVGEKAKKNLSRVNLHIGEGSSGKKDLDSSVDPSEERDRVSTLPSPLPNKFSIRELDKGRTTSRYSLLQHNIEAFLNFLRKGSLALLTSKSGGHSLKIRLYL